MKIRFALPICIFAMSFALVSMADDGQKKAGAAKGHKDEGAKAPQGMPKPPPPPKEIKEAMKAGWSGNWRCEGKDLMMNVSMKGTMSFKLDLSGYWINATWKSPKTKAMPAMLMQEHRTFNTKDGEWVALSVDSMGGWGTASSKDKVGKMTWEGDMYMPGMGTVKSRMHEEMSGPKAVHVWAEGSQDGTTYNKMWEANCKR